MTGGTAPVQGSDPAVEPVPGLEPVTAAPAKPAAPFAMLGDADAAVCVDDVCIVPGSGQSAG